MKKINLFFHEESFWKSILNTLTGKFYNFPVVYEDGYVSSRISDRDRKPNPWGVMIENFIIPINHPQEQMTVVKAVNSCIGVEFAGRQAQLLDIEVLRYIRTNIDSVNAMLTELGGTPFKNGVYVSSRFYGGQYYGINITGPLQEILNIRDLTYCRPAIQLDC